MATGFEILGAITGAITLLKTAKDAYQSLVKTYQGYTEIGHRIVQVRKLFELNSFNIETLIELNGFNLETTDRLYKAFWGEEGWELIRNVLADIQAKCDDLKATVDKELTSTATHDQLAEPDRKRAQARVEKSARYLKHPKWSFLKRSMRSGERRGSMKICDKDESDKDKRIEKLQAQEEYVKKTTNVSVKIKFILSTSDKLESRLKSLEEDVRRFKELLENAWARQHHSIDYKTPYRRRRLAALAKEHDRVLQEAMEKRAEIKALYSCCSTAPRTLWLDVDLLERNTAGHLCKRFRFFLPSFDQDLRLEVSTDILHEQPSLGEEPQDNFLDACKKAHVKGVGLLWTLMDTDQGLPDHRRENHGKTWFRLCKHSEPLQAGQSKIFSLSVSLNTLLKAERIELAYQFAQSGLLLLGTSWLEAIGSNNLGRYKADEKPPRYILAFNRIHQSVLSRALLQNAQREKKDIHLYTFAIGACLVEIALQNRIVEIKLSSSERLIQIMESGTRRSLSARQVIKRVKEEMGDEYSEAVEFCFQDPKFASNREWKGDVLHNKHFTEEEISVELLDLFFNSVFVK